LNKHRPNHPGKYIQADQWVETIMSDYANRSKVDYLRGLAELAHNIEMNS